MDSAGVGKIITISQAVFEGMTPKTDEECAKYLPGQRMGGCRCDQDSDCYMSKYAFVTIITKYAFVTMLVSIFFLKLFLTLSISHLPVSCLSSHLLFLGGVPLSSPFPFLIFCLLCWLCFVIYCCSSIYDPGNEKYGSFILSSLLRDKF